MDPIDGHQDAFPSQHHQKKPPAKTRKRARKACLACRRRKVRCDVSQRGRPCANCHLDDEPCIVTGRASKYRRAQYDVRDGIQASQPPYAPLQNQDNNPASAEVTADTTVAEEGDDVSGDRPPDNIGTDQPLDLDYLDLNQGVSGDNLADEAQPFLPEMCNRQYHPGGQDTALRNDLATFVLQPPQVSAGFTHQWATDGSTASSELSYCCYPFLAISNIYQLPQQSVKFLELQGCLRVPMQPFLDEMVRQYFLHIHPFLPLVNEGDFWETYCCNGGSAPRQHVPLLLFQAMLFASCVFVSESSVQAFGNSNTRSIRATFLQRTKLLYDFETESSPLVKAQACTLLSFASLSSSKTPNTIWLSLAIENARLAEAHLYASVASDYQPKHRNALKRLWWCCITRDRSMSLLMRLPIRITREQFDFDSDPFTAQDLEDELQRSKVYSPATKRRLAEIHTHSIELYTLLTDILMLVLPFNGIPGSVHQGHRDGLPKLDKCRAALRQWYISASSKLPACRTCVDPEASPTATKTTNHGSIKLYMNFMYMYYHTARIVLCHYEVLQLDILRSGADETYCLAKDLSTIFDARRDLQDATSDIIECHRELVRLKLVHWLPSSAIGLVILPLVLNILDMKLSSPMTHSSNLSSNNTQQHLNLLIQVMRAYWSRYDGVDWVSEIIRHISGLVQLDGSEIRRSNSITNWADVFAFQPRSYLRLVLALDLSLSKGRLPQDGDFPLKLRGLFTVRCNPCRGLVYDNGTMIDRRDGSNPEHEVPDSLPQNSFPRQLQGSVLGLDECLITTLENEFDFGSFGELMSVGAYPARVEASSSGESSPTPSTSHGFSDVIATTVEVSENVATGDKEIISPLNPPSEPECQDPQSTATENTSSQEAGDSFI
ncbi:hypothetical protein NM208_g3468 [Fusarium decemcellulare]|uniref:Uncharacterized protein n=1 Tax=Fusarium decemcellulare TaxID=57161 RepID=A0ACC1SNY2_9HYPO|nr:hypothetical protein NM208_g3468 [Fusarium decemcellulare]